MAWSYPAARDDHAMLRKLPIVAQLMALVLVATLLASAAMIGITLRGPPPRAAPIALSSLASALQGERVRRAGGLPMYRETGAEPSKPDDLRRDPEIEGALAELLGENSTVRFYGESSPPGGMSPNIAGQFVASVQNGSGRWTTVSTGPDSQLAKWQLTTAIAVAGVLLLILLAAWLLARRIAKPIRNLATAAAEAKAGERWSYELPEGPPEIRAAAEALDALHRRTLAHADQRMTMLAAIAHDLGSPLARLSFRVEKMPDAARDAAHEDIAAMHRLIGDSLAMARPLDGETTRVDLSEMCRTIVEREMELGREIALGRIDLVELEGHAALLQRMVQNLVDNALRYGGAARIALRVAGRNAELTIADDGPGFGSDEPEKLLHPFVRGEASRNSATGGSGLGLAIVAQAIERHRGTIILANAQGGGGLVTIRLPLG